MNYLAIDCTSDALCIVASKENAVAYRLLQESKMQHSVLCMSVIEEVLIELNLSIEQCDLICGVTGPGSFTGIRVGLSTVLGFAVASQKKAIGVTTFQMLAYDRLERFLAVVDAGKNHFYVCGFDNKQVILPPAHISLAELEALSKEFTLYAFTHLPLPHILLNRAICLKGAIEEAIANQFVNYPLTAYYIKKCQAEENLQNKGKV